MAVPAQLFRLEQLESELDRLQAALAEVRRKQQRDPQVEAAEALLEATRARERAAVLAQRELEGRLTDIEAKIKRDQSRMYGGQIVDPRELASLEKELRSYAAGRDSIETDLLATMEQVEALQIELESLSRRVNQLRQQRETDQPTLTRQIEEMTDELAGLSDERDTLTRELDERTLNMYARLRKSSGHAVSHVSNGVCQWCRVSIPPKDIQHARAGTLATCTNCARILFVG